jgi:preprotein translocase subunit SecF
MVLLVSSCGLFKNKSKTVQSETAGSIKTLKGNFGYDNQVNTTKKTDMKSFAWSDGETRTQLEGEDIMLERSGDVRMRKGKVMIKEIEKSSAVQLARQREEVNRSEKNETSVGVEGKVALERNLSKQVSTPQYRVLLWFSVGLIMLIFLFFRWIRKRIK